MALPLHLPLTPWSAGEGGTPQTHLRCNSGLSKSGSVPSFCLSSLFEPGKRGLLICPHFCSGSPEDCWAASWINPGSCQGHRPWASLLPTGLSLALPGLGAQVGPVPSFSHSLASKHPPPLQLHQGFADKSRTSISRPNTPSLVKKLF